jgi:hypothetical protein
MPDCFTYAQSRVRYSMAKKLELLRAFFDGTDAEQAALLTEHNLTVDELGDWNARRIAGGIKGLRVTKPAKRAA